MQRIGAGQAIIVVLSEKYLKSKNCIYEALQIKEHGDLAARIFPIVLSDANIYEAVTRLKYRKYWEDKIAELNQALRDMTDMSCLASVNEELNNFSEIKRFIDDFMGVVMPNQPAPAPAPPPLKKDYSTLYAEVRNFVARARLEEAIQLLRRGRAELDNDLTGFEQKLAEVKKGEMRGLLDFGEVQKVRNQVTYSILELMS